MFRVIGFSLRPLPRSPFADPLTAQTEGVRERESHPNPTKTNLHFRDAAKNVDVLDLESEDGNTLLLWPEVDNWPPTRSHISLLWNQITPTPLNDNRVMVVVALERQKCVAAEAMTINRQKLRLRRPH